jgi:hypothetical protein
MTRGSVFARAKLPGEALSKAGSVPVAKIFLPHFAAATPIRLVPANRRIAEARPRRPT